MEKLIFIILIFGISLELEAQSVIDTRLSNEPPVFYNSEVKYEFKARGAIGVPGTGDYSGLMTIAPWSDNSGGLHHQLNFNNGGIFYRTGQPDNSSWNNWSQLLTTDLNGNIGIGISTPLAKLHVFNGDNSYGTILANASEFPFSLYTKALTTEVNTEVFRLGLKYGNNENNGFISFYRGYDVAGGYLGFSTNGLERIIINRDGNVGIGTTDTKGFKLGVQGKIAAEEVKVAMYSNWPDFVFETNYNLPTLKEVEQHIKEKGHLKDIPSAKDVKENGIFLGEMDSKLLQKIEELTLYTINQEKRIESLELRNEELVVLLKKLITDKS